VFRRRRPPDFALFDRALYDQVRSIVHQELDDLIEQGRCRIEEETYEGKSSRGEPDGGRIRAVPAREGATALDMTMSDDTISFGAGYAGAWSELWTTAEAEWQTTVRQIVQCVRDGRYSERVRAGRLFPLKVEMRFEGIPSGRGRRKRDAWVISYSDTLAGVDGPRPMPTQGEFDFNAW